MLACCSGLWAPSEPLVPAEPGTAPAPAEPSTTEPTGPMVPTSPTPPTLPPAPDDPTAVPEPTPPFAGDGPLAIELEWNAPTTCPQGDRVRTVVAKLLDREVELEPTADVIVRGDIAPVGSRWLLQLAIESGGTTTQRRLEADRCDTLADAAGLIVATGIDPRRVAATLAEEPPPRRRDVTTVGTARRVAKEPKVRVALGIASGPALGIVPKVAAWLQGDVTLLIKRARVGVQVGHAFDRKTGDRPGAVVRNTSGTLRGCFAPTQGKISLPVCGLFELGATSAKSTGTVSSNRASSLWIATGLGAGFEYAPIRRLALVAQVDALVALRRPRFSVMQPSGDAEVFRVAPAGVRIVLGISVRLP
jgi:hypothetical protein